MCEEVFARADAQTAAFIYPNSPISHTQGQDLLNSTLGMNQKFVHSAFIGTFRAANMRSAKCEQSESPQF
jgi:hypothetical protein